MCNSEWLDERPSFGAFVAKCTQTFSPLCPEIKFDLKTFQLFLGKGAEPILVMSMSGEKSPHGGDLDGQFRRKEHNEGKISLLRLDRKLLRTPLAAERVLVHEMVHGRRYQKGKGCNLDDKEDVKKEEGIAEVISVLLISQAHPDKSMQQILSARADHQLYDEAYLFVVSQIQLLYGDVTLETARKYAGL